MAIAAARSDTVVKWAVAIRLGHQAMAIADRLPGFIPMKFVEVPISQSSTSVVTITTTCLIVKQPLRLFKL